MKTRFLSLLCTALFAAGILLGTATASAHGMTYWEATLVLDDMATGEQNQLEPRKTTLGDARRAIVRAGLADDYQKKDFSGDGMRFITFDFNYAEHCIFRAVTDAKDTRDAGDLTITSYDVMGQSVRTLSGLCVGKSYEDIEEMYGAPPSPRQTRTARPPAHTHLMTKPLRSPSISTMRGSSKRSDSALRSEYLRTQKTTRIWVVFCVQETQSARSPI